MMVVIIEENENQVVSTSVLQGNRLHLSGKKKKKRERERVTMVLGNHLMGKKWANKY